MENASNALIIAGGVLIGVLILSLAVYLFADFGSTSAEINKKTQEQQLVQFNSKFMDYQQAADALLARMAPGDALLVKASRGMALEKALALFYPVCAK